MQTIDGKPSPEWEKRIWSFDMLHVGELCQRVREARRLTPGDIAKWAEVENSTISSQIERNGKGHAKTFRKYVEALQADQINGKPVHTPIAPSQARMLHALHEVV